MDKKIALKLMDSLTKIETPLNNAAKIIESIEDVEEKKKFRKNIGEIMGRLYTDLQRPIIQQYKELDPDK